ncbi:hypothetical protein K491DRAFT_715811 [Lophiostoma macrostomum CBS 122681]|uniref:BTB domain-containing protein n=1 Tax=Lophiostoma macrostomum CBS 122681 TaxID=1314788 RepID=A0A6A6TBI6_9PLEO|nr:hypothetical protein K491DRAFT_715811 [Lophiostoma macrostomum CBS 122681]
MDLSFLFPPEDQETLLNPPENQEAPSAFSPASSTDEHEATTPISKSTITLHDYGDRTLLIGAPDELQPVRVSSDVLRLASPVWRAMLERSWVESKAPEIIFPDDDPEAMLIVLRIAHLAFHELPKKRGLSFESLVNLAIVCDKYDVVGIVRPFWDLYK